MEPEREEEVLLNVACGLDPLTAIVAANDKPPKRTGCGCFSAMLLIAAGIVAWAFLRAVGF